MATWKIITLGTSHGDPTATRFNVSTLLLAPTGEGYLVDAGEPALALLMRSGFALSRLKAVIVTHMHEDHFGGVPSLLKFQTKRLSAGCHTAFFFPEEAAVDGMRRFMALDHRPLSEEVVSLHAYGPGWCYSDGELCLKAIPTDHFSNQGLDFPSYAFLGMLGSKRVLLTGDLSRDFHDFPRGIDADLAFCELTHYDLQQALPILSEQRFGKLCFTHVGNEWQRPDAEARLAKMTHGLPYPCTIAQDGDCFEV